MKVVRWGKDLHRRPKRRTHKKGRESSVSKKALRGARVGGAGKQWGAFNAVWSLVTGPSLSTRLSEFTNVLAGSSSLFLFMGEYSSPCRLYHILSIRHFVDV